MVEYIVNGAKMICDKGELPVKLNISSSRICVGGKPAAHSHNCIPGVNLSSFGLCSSNTYFCSSKAIHGEEHPCVLDLLDHYYLTDEKAVLSDLVETKCVREEIIVKIRELIGFCVSEMTEVQHLCGKRMHRALGEKITEQYGILWRDTRSSPMSGECIEKLSQAIKSFSELARQNCEYLREGGVEETAEKRLEAVEGKLETLTEQIGRLSELTEVEERSLITTESFLVCRCGGMITFYSSGQ